MKKILFSILALCLLTGCNKTETLENGNKIETKGKCTAVECIKKISVENTVEEINDIVGVKGELTDEKYNKYYWELSENTGIEVTYYSSEKGTIKVDIEKDLLVNKKVDFTRYDELSEAIDEGVTYEEFISYIGNVEGTLLEKSSTSNKYIWVAEDGSYLNGTFSNRTGECSFASGMIK